MSEDLKQYGEWIVWGKYETPDFLPMDTRIERVYINPQGQVKNDTERGLNTSVECTLWLMKPGVILAFRTVTLKKHKSVYYLEEGQLVKIGTGIFTPTNEFIKMKD